MHAFGFHLEHDIFGRGFKPDPSAGRVDTSRLAKPLRDVVLALILGPELLGFFRVAAQPRRSQPSVSSPMLDVHTHANKAPQRVESSTCPAF